MPQLDISTFASQIFWLLVTFAVLYFLLSTLVIPRVGGVLESRHNKISGDLAKAEQMRKEAEKTQVEYEAVLKQSRSKAQALIAESSVLVEKSAAERRQEHAQLLKAEQEAAEAAVFKARNQALMQLEPLAKELTHAVVAKLAQVSLTEAEVTAALEDKIHAKAA